MNATGGELPAAARSSIGRRKLRAPRNDRGVLIDPAWESLPNVVAANISARRRWSLDVAGENVASFTASARAEFVAAAIEYTRQYRNVPLSPLPLPLSPLLLAGHQPELFHAGVWAKNFALSGLAAAVGGTAINLVIDGDTLKTASLRVPTGTAAEPHVESVEFDAAGEEIPFEARGVLDGQTFASFGRRAAATLRPLLPDPLLETFWPEAVRQADACRNLGLAIARARHRLEGSWGLSTLELPQSRMCDSRHFRRFVGHLLADLPRFVEAHNFELLDYRRRENIRSAHHPVPELKPDGPWFEAPLWLWTVDEPRRRRAFARRRGGELELSDRGSLSLTLPLADPRHDDLAAALDEAARSGVRLRSRALLTTMYARLVLGDLFLHGIGGGKYDELTDAIVRRFFGVEPPEFAVVTATRKLPVVGRPATSTSDKLSTPDEPEARRRLWEMRHHPERFLNLDDLPNSTERAAAATAVAEKLRWTSAEPSPETARIRCQAIRYANESMQPLLAAERAKWLEIQAKARHQARTDEILGSREFSAFLFPENDLRDFLLAIAAGSR